MANSLGRILAAGTRGLTRLLLAGSLLAALASGSALAADDAPTRTPAPVSAASDESACVACHEQTDPGIVSDWKASLHGKVGVGCTTCHGDRHTTAEDFAEVRLPTPEVCETCHATQVTQFKGGKHALAWAAMNAMPTTHMLPLPLTQGLDGCGGCHQIGLKTEAEILELKKHGGAFGVASCDTCHTRHTFSAAEARQPEACRTCHMGFDHPQAEMYEASKHGVRYSLQRLGDLPAEAPAPTCQTCHMPEGNHSVLTAWGYLAVRLPMPNDPQWAADRTTILKALGVLDPEGKPTARLEVVKEANVARLTEEAWQQQRDEMIATCKQCHAENFARGELEKGDTMIREADHLQAEAIRIVADLYRDGILRKPESYAYAYPDLLTFQDAPTEIEQRLFVMFLGHRTKTFMGTFHGAPDYTFWYGWSEMKRNLTEIETMAADLRREHAGKPEAASR
jgi:hypothetical protein